LSNIGKYLEKRIVRIIVGAKPGRSCRSLFKKLGILLFPCQYVFLLMNFIVNNEKKFKMTLSVHIINTRNKQHLYRPVVNLFCFQKSAYFAGIRVFNSLLCSLTSLGNEKAQQKVALTRYLIIYSSCPVDEFFV
jgi:hypothetical protein